jgi:hypothetical protein
VSSGALYLWGALGGGVSAVLVYAVPELIHAARTATPNMTWARAGFIVLLVLVLAAIAGIVPLLPDSAPSRGGAIAMGLGADTILKGILSGAQDAVRPPAPIPGVDVPAD